jgi:hypothetical protein
MMVHVYFPRMYAPPPTRAQRQTPGRHGNGRRGKEQKIARTLVSGEVYKAWYDDVLVPSLEEAIITRDEDGETYFNDNLF